MIEKIDSSRFNWENAGIRLGYTVADIFPDCDSTAEIPENYEIIGYTNGTDVIRNRTDTVAVLFYDKELDQNFWLHIGRSTAYLRWKIPYKKIKQQEETK